MRYVVDFGADNTGGVPTWTTFKRLDTLASLATPALTEIPGTGQFWFDYDWSSAPAGVTSIVFKISLAGIELSDVINSDQTAITASGVGSAGAAALPWLWTAKEILNAVAVQVGLAAASSPYSSSDANFVRLRNALNLVGLELSKARDWKVLTKEVTFTGDGASTTFNLPADFLRFVDDSGFDRSNRWPIGLVGSPGWQYLKATSLGAAVVTLYRVVQGRMQFYQALATGAVVASDYVSRLWAKTAGAVGADLYYPTQDTDLVMFEPDLAVAALKYRYLVQTGQEASGAREEYDTALEGAAGTEPAQTLSLGGSGAAPSRVGAANLPITGWGQ